MPVTLSTADVNNFTAADVGITSLVGMLIVFAVLAVIFLCLSIMERIFRVKKPSAEVKTVVAPFSATIESVSSVSSVKVGDAVLTAVSESGTMNQIFSPETGTIKFAVNAGDHVKKGAALFTVE